MCILSLKFRFHTQHDKLVSNVHCKNMKKQKICYSRNFFFSKIEHHIQIHCYSYQLIFIFSYSHKLVSIKLPLVHLRKTKNGQNQRHDCRLKHCTAQLPHWVKPFKIRQLFTMSELNPPCATIMQKSYIEGKDTFTDQVILESDSPELALVG